MGTCTLSFIEKINSKRATERAIAKLLNELERETGVRVEKIYLEKMIGYKGLSVKIETTFNFN